MIFLLLSILLNTYVAVCFTVFQRLRISNLQAIVVNYLVCVVTGCLVLGHHPFTYQNLQQPFFSWGVLNGFSYFTIFNLIAYCTLKNGIAATQVANKLSLVIPVFLAHFLFHDNISFLKIVGVAIAIFAVYFTSYKNNKNENTSNSTFLSILLFIGSGLIDTQTKYVQTNYLHTNAEANAYLIICFAMAGLLGLMVLTLQFFRKKEVFTPRNLAGGIILGIPNYFSIFVLIKTLSSNFLQASAIIPVNNIGIVLFSTILSLLVFKQKLVQKNYIGLF